MISASEILRRIRKEGLDFPPLSLRVLDPLEKQGGAHSDLRVEARRGRRKFRFMAQVRSLATPGIFRQTLALARASASADRSNPLMLVPFLPEARLQDLEAAGVSGIDLSGNGIVIVREELLVYRTGRPNRYPRSALIRNIYRGRSSIVARAFLIRPTHATVTELNGFIQDRGARVAFSTVSKVLKGLEEDLVVGRAPGPIRLLQAEKLLDKLADNYEPPKVAGHLAGKCSLSEANLLAAVTRGKRRIALTGAGSVGAYAVMAREPLFSFYCDADPGSVVRGVDPDFEAGGPFPNLELIQTDDDRVYFDTRTANDRPFASPVQTWLELRQGDKRDRETAEQVKRYILDQIGRGPIA